MIIVFFKSRVNSICTVWILIWVNTWNFFEDLRIFCDKLVNKITQGKMAASGRYFKFADFYLVANILLYVYSFSRCIFVWCSDMNRRDWCMLYAIADTCDGFDGGNWWKLMIRDPGISCWERCCIPDPRDELLLRRGQRMKIGGDIPRKKYIVISCDNSTSIVCQCSISVYLKLIPLQHW